MPDGAVRRLVGLTDAAPPARVALGTQLQCLHSRSSPLRVRTLPMYAMVERYEYGRNRVKSFIETGLLCSGPLGLSLPVQLDHFFPGRENHNPLDVEP